MKALSEFQMDSMVPTAPSQNSKTLIPPKFRSARASAVGVLNYKVCSPENAKTSMWKISVFAKRNASLQAMPVFLPVVTWMLNVVSSTCSKAKSTLSKHFDNE